MSFDTVIHAARAITASGDRSCAVAISDGRIVAIEAFGATLDTRHVLRLESDEVLIPGLVDTHVHINDPGRNDWEGFATATSAAGAGGITTLIDMPLNCIPPTCDVASLEVKRKTAAGECAVDVGFWGGAIPGNIAHLRPLHEAGVFGFKCFLLPSGVDEFPPLDDDGLRAAMREIAGFDGLLVVHAEDAQSVHVAAHRQDYESFLRSRPPEAETRAIPRVIELARATGCRVHILHVSSAAALPMLADARDEGVRLSVETCPHYLTFAAEDIADGATQFKCCPPIRDGANRDALWDGLRAGVIDLVVSDHSPCTPELRSLDEGDFGQAWGGIASLQIALPALWTQARARGFALPDVVRWMAEGPAALAGLKFAGRLDVGAVADLCVLAPDAQFVVDPLKLKHRNPVTPYGGQRLSGVVRRTLLHGVEITDQPAGRLLIRGDA